MSQPSYPKYTLTHSTLVEALSYNPNTGIFIRKSVFRESGGAVNYIGKRAGSINQKNGYRYISVMNKIYNAHRLAWFYSYKEWPNGPLDHVNRNRDDNRLCNLRLATPCENQLNRGAPCHNTSGFKGVSKHKKTGLWRPRIKVFGQEVCLGYFHTAKDAASAYDKAARRLCGAFACTNKKYIVEEK